MGCEEQLRTQFTFLDITIVKDLLNKKAREATVVTTEIGGIGSLIDKIECRNHCFREILKHTMTLLKETKDIDYQSIKI